MSKYTRTDITGIGDPFTLLYDGKYYIYATNAPDGFRVYTSDDLITLKDEGYCYKDCPWGMGSYWAPEVIYFNGKFIMHYTCRWKEKKSLRMSTAVADSPLGPFKDISDTPLFEFGYAAIDGTAFIDDDGQGYFYFSRDCSENEINGIHESHTYCVKLDSEMLRPVGEPVFVSAPTTEWEKKSGDWRWNEGPAMLKHNGKYYLSYSANYYAGKYYSVCYSTSTKPMEGFIKAAENPILSYIEGEMSGPGHNAYFKDKEGNLMTSFHIHTDYDHPSGNRRICFAPVHFENDKLVIDYKD